MGPLVPFIISSEFGLVIAILVGIAFGFILEQAGFSSTKKLVGLFYGYDFTVLRVFFTAGVTAMTGVLVLGHYGLLDLSVIYINPTFVRSAVVGGLVMGAGFIIGGFCPGTSVCAAAIGKIDGMFFILGSIIGAFAFVEVYPYIEDFYFADAMGPIRINEFFNISVEFFGFLLTLVAILAFVMTWFIENKVNRKPNEINAYRKRKYALAMIVPFFFIAWVWIFPGKKEIIQNRIADAQRQKECVFHEISADKLAYEIVNHYYDINVIDVRSAGEFEKYHIPMAINIPFDQLMERQWEDIFKQGYKTNIFYAEDDTVVKMSCLKARFIGNSTNLILSEPVSKFRQMYTNIEKPLPLTTKQEYNTYFYRKQLAREMDDLVESLQNFGKPVKKEIKRVSGGCT